MQVSLDAADLQPIIDRAVKTALEQFSAELRSLLATASSNRLKTVPEVAADFQVCERTVRNWADNGDLVATRIGSSIRFAQTDLDEFIAARKGILEAAS